MRRQIAAIVLVLVRSGRLRRRLVRLLAGWDVHPSAIVGLSWLDVDHVRLADRSSVASLSVIRLETLSLAEGATIGPMNWISGPRRSTGLFPNSPRRDPALRMGRESAVTSRHRLDCSDSITLDDFSLIAGSGSQILTHAIDFETSAQRATGVTLGRSSVLMTNVTVLPGVLVADNVLVAAGSVVIGSLRDEYTLYAGVPAKAVKSLARDTAFFSRRSGFVR